MHLNRFSVEENTYGFTLDFHYFLFLITNLEVRGKVYNELVAFKNCLGQQSSVTHLNLLGIIVPNIMLDETRFFKSINPILLGIKITVPLISDEI